MPNRIMRDDLLFSRRYWSVPENSQHLFFHLCLSVDDYGCFPADPFAINAKCYPNHPKGSDAIVSMVDQLAGADLLRLYEVNGQQFLFIPRFRQRQRFNPKYPLPPKEISDLDEKDRHLDSRLQNRQPVDKSAEKKRPVDKSKTPVLDKTLKPISAPKEINHLEGKDSPTTVLSPSTDSRESAQRQKDMSIAPPVDKSAQNPHQKERILDSSLKSMQEPVDNFLPNSSKFTAKNSDSNEINDLNEKDRLETVGRQEKTNTNTNIKTDTPYELETARSMPACAENPKTGLLENHPKPPKPNGQGGKWWTTNEGIDRKGRELGMFASSYDTYDTFKEKIFDELRRRKVADC